MKKMKISMISQPMNGMTDEKIKENKERAVKHLNSIGYDVINTFYEDFNESSYQNIGLAYLGASIMDMAKTECLYMCKGWENARGCRLEHECAKAYGLTIIYE